MNAANAPLSSSSIESERRAHEPSMEEILASIRKIIADDDALPLSARFTPAPPPPRLFETNVASTAPSAAELETDEHEPVDEAGLDDEAPEFEAPDAAVQPEIFPEPPVSLLRQAAPQQAAPQQAAPQQAAPQQAAPQQAAPAPQQPAVPNEAPVPQQAGAQPPAGAPAQPFVRSDAAVQPHAGAPLDRDELASFAEVGRELSHSGGAFQAGAQPATAAAPFGLRAALPAEEGAYGLRPAPEGEASAMLSPEANASVASAFQALSASVQVANSEMIERHVREMLRPMLKQWLDDNLPVMVERLVRTEIERVARGGR